eukprot:GHVR01055770.1.p1 GENE.GHVR01055770.1~~GHVR01055770.1.p1  ORF type:complete len:294 (+),score=23.55 GHVR01055770.1:2387-3268(+)
MSFNLNEKKGIPLAYDYDSDSGDSSGSYRDLNTGAADLTDFIEAYGVSDRPEVFHSTLNTAGLGYGKGSAFYFDLQSTDVSAVVCSTNTYGGLAQIASAMISCGMDFTNRAGVNALFDGAVGTAYTVTCPSGCVAESQTNKVFGKSVHSPESSICSAALFEGVIGDAGGIFSISTENGRAKYTGDFEQNAIKVLTVEKADADERSFTVSRVFKDCPIDLYERAPQPISFIQLSSAHQGSTENKRGTDEKISEGNKEAFDKVLAQMEYMAAGVDHATVNSKTEEASRILASGTP